MKETIEKFYSAFQHRDAQTMNGCYHEDVVFEDPGFGVLKGDDARAMWSMLCQNAKDFRLEYSNLTQNSAHWEAWYTFSRTGRRVHNIIDAQFEFEGNKIIKHTDHFNLHRWASQAMGWQGRLLGGTGFFKKKLHQSTRKLLDDFKAKAANK